MDEYQDLLRCTVATAGNDHRLGADEAPPAIVSIFLGDELNGVVRSIIDGTNYPNPEKRVMRIGVDVMPAIPQDTTDRNRTSPLAFTGNKFEFRMLGSSQSVAEPNIALNTIMAEELCQFANIQENAEDFDKTLHELVCKTFTDHQRIIFDGNGYSEEWRMEAQHRGLSNYPSSAEALAHQMTPKNIDLVTRRGIFTETEFRARHAVHLDTYCKIIIIEARAMIDMAQRQILPAALDYTHSLCSGVAAKKAIGAACKAEAELIQKLSAATDGLSEAIDTLSRDLARIPAGEEEKSAYCHKTISADMAILRREADFRKR